MTSLVLLTIIGFVLFMSRGIVGPVSSLYAQELGASYVMLSALGTTTSIFSVVASYMWGRTSDMVGRRKTFMLWGLVVLSVEALLTAMIPHFGGALAGVKPFVWLFPLRLAGTIGTAAFSTSNLAMLGDLTEARLTGRGSRIGLVRGISSAGFGLMAFTAGKIADTFQINVPYYVSAALLAVAFVLALAIKEERFQPTAALPRFDWHSAWASFVARFRDAWAVVSGRDVVLDSDSASTGPKLPLAPLLIASFLFSLMMGSVYEVWANYMKHEAGFTTTVVTVLWATASTSEFPLMILAGWLSDRVGRLPMLSLGYLAWMLVILGYIVVPVMPWIVVVQLVRGFAFSAVTATSMAYAAEARGRSQRGQVSGLYGAMGGVGSIIGAAMGGTLTQWLAIDSARQGFHRMFGIAAAAMLAGAIYFVVVYVRQRRLAAAPGQR